MLGILFFGGAYLVVVILGGVGYVTEGYDICQGVTRAIHDVTNGTEYSHLMFWIILATAFGAELITCIAPKRGS